MLLADAFLLLPLLLVFFATFTQAQEFLKLRLHHASSLPSPDQVLAFDAIRLASLSSTSRSTPGYLSVPVISGASAGAGQYFVDFHLGTPPQRLRLVADTGSDLVWARCSACRDCSRHPPGSVFLPRHSSSFRLFHCYHPSCRLVPAPSHSPRCNHTRLHSPCRYRYSYADRSSSAGFFSRELATLNASSGTETRLADLPFGCAFNVSGGAGLTDAHGIMGLGRGPISFPSHAGSFFGHTFSYCLMDYTLSPPPTSYLLIGSSAASPSLHPKLSFTPLESNPLSPTYYYLRVLGAYVDGSALPIHPSVWTLDPKTGNGGTVIDSGTTLTFVPDSAYNKILHAIAKRLPKAVVSNAGPPAFDLCVNTSAKGVRIPRLSFRLLGGAQLAPPPRNYFIDAAEGVRCLALQPVGTGGSGFGVLGNLMQQGFLFVFDRDASRLGFAHTGCTQ